MSPSAHCFTEHHLDVQHWIIEHDILHPEQATIFPAPSFVGILKAIVYTSIVLIMWYVLRTCASTEMNPTLLLGEKATPPRLADAHGTLRRVRVTLLRSTHW